MNLGDGGRRSRRGGPDAPGLRGRASGLPYAAALAALALAYFAAAVLGLRWAEVGGAGSPVWPAFGFSLAGLLIGGVRLWPAVVVGRLAAGLATGSDQPLWAEVSIAGANGVADALAVLLLTRVGRLDLRLGALRDVLWLAGGAALSAVVSATLGSATLLLSSGLTLTQTGDVWIHWWFGSVVAGLTITPLLLAWSRPGAWSMGPRHRMHLALCLASTAMLAAFVFFVSGPFVRVWHVYPLLIWAALAFQVRGAAAALVLASSLAILSTTLGTGPFADLLPDPAGRMFLAQQFVAITALVMLLLAAVVDERRTREGEERFRDFVEGAPEKMWVNASDGSPAFFNAAWRDYTGQAHVPVGLGWTDVIHSDDRPIVLERRRAATASGQAYSVELRLRRARDGAFRWHTGSVAPVRRDREIVAWVGTGVDIHDRHEAEEALRQGEARLRDSEARLRVVTDNARVGLVVNGPDHRYRFANQAYADILGLSSADLSGQRIADVLPHVYETQIKPRLDRAFAGETVTYDLMVPPRGKEGERRYAVTYQPGTSAQGELVVIVVIYEVTERVRAEADLRQANDLLRSFMGAVPGVIYAKDRQGRVLVANRGTAELIGKDPAEFIGKTDAEFLDDSAQGAVIMANDARIMELGTSEQVEEDVSLPGGMPAVWLSTKAPLRDAGGEVVGLVGSSIDITARKKAEAALERLNGTLEARVAERTADLLEANARLAQETAERIKTEAELHQVQKLETLGQLTGGVAHDFNNLLTPIMASLDIIRRRVPMDERMGRLLGGAMESAERAKTLVARLLAFARRQTLEAKPVDLGALVAGMTDLVERSLGPAVGVTVDVPEDLPPAKVDPAQLELALLNLAVNARDAMSGEGDLAIAAREERIEEHDSHGLASGRYLVLAVTDTGLGMDEATLARAVEPFFSTKGVGLGTGLGLSMVHGLAAQSGGRLVLTSQPGQGTTAAVWLPVADRVAPVGAAAAVEPASARREATVLIVDDEELVRAGMAEMLRDLGYTVAEASGGTQALELLRSGLVPDVVVTDYLMPGMNGIELAQELQRRLPTVPALLVTGYAQLSEDAASHLPRLAKPFRQADLAARLDELLTRNRGKVVRLAPRARPSIGT